jgi:predicted dehydrogenase
MGRDANGGFEVTSGREVAVGIVGLGFGRNHARVLHELPGARLAAVCDRDEERLAATAAGRNIATFMDHRDMLRETALDAAIVAVPTHLHASVAMDAIATGCATMIEKPIAPSLPEARAIVDAAEDAGVPLMHGHIERFNPAVQELLRRLKAGDAGDIVQLASRRLAYFAPRVRDVDIGVVHDLAFHEIDVTRLLAGCEVERVYAETQSDLRTPFEDAVNATLRFRGNERAPGPIATLQVHWLSPRKVRELSVLCERGEFILDYQDQTLQFRPAQSLREGPGGGFESAAVYLQGDEPPAPIDIPIEKKEPLYEELSAFVNAVRSGSPMPVGNEDALAAIAVADALVQSGRTGRAIDL